VIDESVVITGSFNWTSQAVNFNQENILFYENKEIAQKYIAEFNKLWNEFEVIITYTLINSGRNKEINLLKRRTRKS
jgi:phosphatidylserine/phosphatidylglycerophosphate/cardiolipin synthase-like enzyme